MAREVPLEFTVHDPFEVTINATSTALIAAAPRRVGIFITNTGTQDMFLSFGTTTAVVGTGIFVPRNGGSLLLDDSLTTKQSIQAIAKNATTTATVCGCDL